MTAGSIGSTDPTFRKSFRRDSPSKMNADIVRAHRQRNARRKVQQRGDFYNSLDNGIFNAGEQEKAEVSLPAVNMPKAGRRQRHPLRVENVQKKVAKDPTPKRKPRVPAQQEILPKQKGPPMGRRRSVPDSMPPKGPRKPAVVDPAFIAKIVMNLQQKVRMKYRSLSKAFLRFDRDRNGRIDMKEMRRALVTLGVCTQAELRGGVLESLFSFCDTDSAGKIDYEEFSEAMSDLHQRHQDSAVQAVPGLEVTHGRRKGRRRSEASVLSGLASSYNPGMTRRSLVERAEKLERDLRASEVSRRNSIAPSEAYTDDPRSVDAHSEDPRSRGRRQQQQDHRRHHEDHRHYEEHRRGPMDEERTPRDDDESQGYTETDYDERARHRGRPRTGDTEEEPGYRHEDPPYEGRRGHAEEDGDHADAWGVGKRILPEHERYTPRHAHDHLRNKTPFQEWNPWGKPGAGAPIKDVTGQVLADLRNAPGPTVQIASKAFVTPPNQQNMPQYRSRDTDKHRNPASGTQQRGACRPTPLSLPKAMEPLQKDEPSPQSPNVRFSYALLDPAEQEALNDKYEKQRAMKQSLEEQMKLKDARKKGEEARKRREDERLDQKIQQDLQEMENRWNKHEGNSGKQEGVEEVGRVGEVAAMANHVTMQKRAPVQNRRAPATGGGSAHHNADRVHHNDRQGRPEPSYRQEDVRHRGGNERPEYHVQDKATIEALMAKIEAMNEEQHQMRELLKQQQRTIMQINGEDQNNKGAGLPSPFKKGRIARH